LWWRLSVNTADILLGVVKLQVDRYIQDAFITFFKIRITTYRWGDIFGAGFGGFEDSEFRVSWIVIIYVFRILLIDCLLVLLSINQYRHFKSIFALELLFEFHVTHPPPPSFLVSVRK